jgi:hypothetical protein
MAKAVVTLQLYDNLQYHVDSTLLEADVAGVKDLTSKLVPLTRVLRGPKKLFISLLARSWLDPC